MTSFITRIYKTLVNVTFNDLFVDTEKPKFVNCPNSTVFHDPYQATSMDKLMVTDNSGADQDSLRMQVKFSY